MSETRPIEEIRASMLKDDGKGINVNKVFEYVKQHEHVKIWKRDPYLYEHGVYVEDTDGVAPGVRIKTKIRDLIAPEFRNAEIENRIYKMFLNDSGVLLTEANEQPRTWINFLNGFYDVEKGEFHEHTPDVFSLNQIPFEYKPDEITQGEETERFLNFALYRENALELFLEFGGLMLTTDRTWQKFLLLIGMGGNGKSVLIDMMENVIGEKNCARLGMADLEQRFAKAEIVGKLANLCADLKTEARKDIANFKQFTGGDALRAENKGVRGFKFRPYAKNLFSANAVPRLLGEESDAIYRRMLVLKIDRKPEKPDPALPEKLKAEAPHFLHMCVEALKRLYDRGEFINCPSSEEEVEQAKRDNNSVDAFLQEMCETGSDCKTIRTYLYEKYKAFCESEGRIPKNNVGFYQVLRLKGFQDAKINGERYMRGIRVKEEDMKNEAPGVDSLPTFSEPTPEQANMFESPTEKPGPTLEEIAEGMAKIQAWIASVSATLEAAATK